MLRNNLTYYIYSLKIFQRNKIIKQRCVEAIKVNRSTRDATQKIYEISYIWQLMTKKNNSRMTGME